MATGYDILKWIKRYDDKLGGSFLEDWEIDFYPMCYVFPDGSLFTYTIFEHYLEVGPVSFEFWEAWPTINAIAKSYGLKEVATVTPRNPEAYCRLTGAKWTESKFVGGKWLHRMIKEVE